jgi:hypothetical protein
MDSGQIAVTVGPTDPAAAQRILTDPTIPWAHPVAYLNALSLDSVATVFVSFQNQPVAAVRMTIPLVKTYAQALLTLVADYEKATGQTVLTFEQIQEKIGTMIPTVPGATANPEPKSSKG